MQGAWPERRLRTSWGSERAKVLRQDPGGRQWLVLTVRAPRIARWARPGQFAQLRVPPQRGASAAPAGAAADPSSGEGLTAPPGSACLLLRRPLSFAGIDPQAGELTFVYRVVGPGTSWLASAQADDGIDLLGPLGRSFPDPSLVPDPRRPLLLVGGGSGIAPLGPAAAWARAAGRPTEAILGAREAGELAGAALVAATGVPCHITTEDGSAGRRGMVSAVLEELLPARPAAEVWACGPEAMLRAVRALCRRHAAEVWLSLEGPMACGFGVCMGCAIPRAEGCGYLRACVDGPVFSGEEVWPDV